MKYLRNVSIGQKILIAVLAVNILGLGVMATVLHDRSSRIQIATAIDSAANMAGKHAAATKNQLDSVMTVARTLGGVMERLGSIQASERRDLLEVMMSGVLKGNPQFHGIWTIWEPNEFDALDYQYAGQDGQDKSGRVNIYYFRAKDGDIWREEEPSQAFLTPGLGDYYQIPLKTGAESIIDPYMATIDGDNVLMVTLSVPIKTGGRVVGVVGIDLPVTGLQSLVADINPYGAGEAAIFGNKGVVVAHYDPARPGKNMLETERNRFFVV